VGGSRWRWLLVGVIDLFRLTGGGKFWGNPIAPDLEYPTSNLLVAEGAKGGRKQ